jgi:ParB family chromosome partitioning protein
MPDTAPAVAQFIAAYPLDLIQPAAYNPRRIQPANFAELVASIQELGVIKPVIINAADVTVAGHQRSKACQAAGLTHVPVVKVGQVGVEDEVRFNQLHNGTDFDNGLERCWVAASGQTGYALAPASSVRADFNTPGAPIRKETSLLLIKYGNWGGCVATLDGEVLTGAAYAMACKLISMPLRVYYVDAARAKRVRLIFQKQYGEFSYDHLPRETYVQSFAQMFRLRDGEGKAARRANLSATYENLLLPNLKPGERVLDFGCGQADYVKRLKSKGVPIHGIEFFHRKGNDLDIPAIYRMIDEVLQDLARHGLYDVVISDYVLNSVNSLQAEADVLTCLNAFCKPGGKVYFSGRTWEGAVEGANQAKTDMREQRRVYFLDDDGFSALYQHGNWFFQRFHTKVKAEALARRYFSPQFHLDFQKGLFQLATRKQVELPLAERQASIEREFNLIWPGGRTVNRHREMWQALKQAHGRAI